MGKIIVLEIVMKKSVVSEGYPGFPGITVGRIPRPVNKKLEGSEVTWVSCVRHRTNSSRSKSPNASAAFELPIKGMTQSEWKV